MSVRFNAPPGWPEPSPSWVPDADWLPDPAWPPAPRDWAFWIVDDGPGEDPAAAGEPSAHGTPRFGSPPRTTAATYGTDRGSWLAGLRSRATTGSTRAVPEPEPQVVRPAPVAVPVAVPVAPVVLAPTGPAGP